MQRIDLPADPAAALAQLQQASRDHTVVVFKKSPICPVSTFAEAQFDEWRGGVKDDAGLAYALIDVIAEKPLARGLVAALDIRHESPQALVFRDGDFVWHGSHNDLTVERFTEKTAAV